MKIKCLCIAVLLLLLIPVQVEAKSDVPPKMYSVIIDRFLNGSDRNNKEIHNDGDDALPLGGDFQGIKSKIDYIKEMGFDTLHVSPVFDHELDDFLGYKVIDYNRISKIYGGAKELKALIKEVHKNDMKIIVDMPMTYVSGYKAAEPSLNDLQRDYYKDTKIIDLQNENNQKKYKEMVTNFARDYDIDGVSIYALQDNLDADKIFPDNVMRYAILNKGDNAQHFDYIQKAETTEALANAFKTTDQNIPAEYDKNEVLTADNFFMPRFTKYAAEANMFPGTRIKLLMGYLLIENQPSSMTYGTEIAMNGDKLADMHQLLDFRTDKEVIDYLKDTSAVYHKYKEMYDGSEKVIHNTKGNQAIFFDTPDVDFIYNLNNTSKATNIKLKSDIVPEGKMLSGLLIGDSIHEKDGAFNLITNREEAELYAIVPARGLNWGYFVAAAAIVILFSTFIVLVAKRSKRNKAAL